MKRLLTALTILCLTTVTHGQGIPFIRNFLANEYQANNTNYDIETDEYGHVFVANFEGLMYYDFAEWHIIHTPGITRVTVVYRATDNTIWVGGYNYFGKVVRKVNGDIELQRIGSPDLFRGEVLEIYEQDGILQLIINNGMIYQVMNDKLTAKKNLIKILTRVYGQPPTKKYKPDDMDHVGGYYKNHQDGFQIDDTTWNDLNMDGIFKRLNYCLSAAGEEYLYYMLRTPKQEDDFEDLEKQVDFFQNNDEVCRHSPL